MATVQTKSAQGSSSTATVNITTSAGNLLGIVTTSFGGTLAVPTRTGETNNNAVADFVEPNNNHARGDYMMNIAGNANAVTGTGTVNGTDCCVTEFSGRKTTVALGAVNHGVSTASATTCQPGSVTPTAGSDLMTGMAFNSASGSAAATIDSGFTVDEIGGAGTVWDALSVTGGSAHKDNVAAVAVNPTWTDPPGQPGGVGALIMEFLAVVVSGTPVSDPSRSRAGARATDAGVKVLLGNQLDRPTSDVSNDGSWTNEVGSTIALYASVDELYIDDSDYIKSPVAPTVSSVVLRLSDPEVPGVGPKTLKVRMGKDVLGGEPVNVVVELLQGAAIIQTWGFADIAPGNITKEMVITANIADWTTPLDVRITAGTSWIPSVYGLATYNVTTYAP